MHTIEPLYKWRDLYVASDDKKSPFYGREYSEFTFSNRIYNYLLHPQWDDFGSPTLYTKILYVDYSNEYAIIEMIGEWNDCINNDIMYFKREVIDVLASHGIKYYIIMTDNVLNFHASDESYYEEWYDDVVSEGGYIVFINTSKHVREEMETERLQYYINFGEEFNDINWQGKKPNHIFLETNIRINQGVKQLRY